MCGSTAGVDHWWRLWAGWLLLPLIGLAVTLMVPVGKESCTEFSSPSCTDMPNDDAESHDADWRPCVCVCVHMMAFSEYSQDACRSPDWRCHYIISSCICSPKRFQQVYAIPTIADGEIRPPQAIELEKGQLLNTP